jgi:glycerol kinase
MLVGVDIDSGELALFAKTIFIVVTRESIIMLNQRYAAIDQGTTATRVVVLDENGYSHSSLSIPHKQITPKNGWVEHDAEEILANIQECLSSCSVVDAIGLCHQGESIVAWHADTGKPLYNAIIWQDMRTEGELIKLKEQGLESKIMAKTGLLLDPYFSSSKMGWILKNVIGAESLAKKGKLRIGTMDAFFIDRLCGNFYTDYNSASRTSLFNIHTLEWDAELCEIFGVPIDCLPEVKNTIDNFGLVDLSGRKTPVTALIIDQFAGMYGHQCRKSGDAKVTFGTGTFVQSLTGHEIKDVGESGLVPTLCWKFPNEEAVFGLDGGVYNAASAINWVRKIGLFNHFDELDNFSSKSAISRGLAFVPALSGLACPYWDRSAAGVWTGLSLETDRKDMLQSVLEGIALRSAEVILAMDKISPLGDTISIDGGLSANKYFKQFLANIVNKILITPDNKEVTAIGVAMLARKGFGVTHKLHLNQNHDITNPQEVDRDLILKQYQTIIALSRGLRT